MKKGTHFSKRKSITALILNLIVCSLAVIFTVNSVKAESRPILSKELRHNNFCPFFKNNGPQNGESLQVGFVQPSYGLSCQPYMAGYNYLSGSPGYDRATAVRVTVSFKGTDNSIIQDGNALAAGIAAQGQSTSGSFIPPISPYIDFGYTMLLVVDNQYNWPYIEGTVFSVYEWGLDNLWPLEDPVISVEAHFSWEFPYVLTMDSNVTLIMKWDSDPDVLSFSAIIDDWPEYPIYTLIPSDIQSRYFMLGTEQRYHTPADPLTDTVKFFQFPGAWSNENIGQVGWHSYLDYPGFIRTGESSWTNVTFAYSVNGTTSWLDNTVTWGGACYDNVTADYTHQHLHFYPTSDGTTLAPDTLLWSPPLCALKTESLGFPQSGYFYVPAVASDLLKIEFLFNTTCPGLTGDQTGGEPLYGTITTWPDGKVDVKDTFMVAKAYGAIEQSINWTYMADVHPDRKIDIKDIFTVAKSYGYSGTYPQLNLTGIKIIFNTGQIVTPDSKGFVSIPQGAINFTITQNDTLIGALITFW
jgi:hypothetical protein